MSEKDGSLLLTEGDIKARIVRFALPIFLGQLCQQLYNAVDSIVVGNLIGDQALAAVSSTTSLIFMIIGFFMGLSTGAGIVISRNLGAGDMQRVESSVHTTVAMGLAFSALTTVLGVVLSPLALQLLGTPDDVMPLAVVYLRFYFAGSLGLIMYNAFMGILQASGDSRHPLYYLIFSSALNVVLDLLFVGAFGLGIAGAAVATGLSQLASAGLGLHRLIHKGGMVSVDLRRIRFVRRDLAQILRYGLPTGIQNSVIDFSNLLIQSYINSFGSVAMAGIGAYAKLEGFAMLPINALQMAMSTFVSQNRGAGRFDRMKQGIRFGELMGVIVTEAIGLTLAITAPSTVRLFSQSADVVAYGVAKAAVCGPCFFLIAYSHVTSAVLRGIGRPVLPMVVLLTCWCAMRVLVLATVGQAVHVIELCYWIYPMTWGLSAFIYLFVNARIRRQTSFSTLA